MDHATRETSSSASSTRVVDVLVPVALNQNYSYRVPRGMELKPGDVVCVPLGPREVVAVVWAENANPDPRLHNRLKDVGEKLDVPPLKEELRSLVDWVANYTLSARGMVLRMALRMGENLGPERMRLGVRLVGEPPRRLTPARRRLIEVLSDGLLHGKSEAAREAGVSGGVVDGLRRNVDSRHRSGVVGEQIAAVAFAARRVEHALARGQRRHGGVAVPVLVPDRSAHLRHEALAGEREGCGCRSGRGQGGRGYV